MSAKLQRLARDVAFLLTEPPPPNTYTCLLVLSTSYFPHCCRQAAGGAQTALGCPVPGNQSQLREVHNTSLRCAGLRLGPDSGLIIMIRRCLTARPFSASSRHTGSTHGVDWKPHDSYSLQGKHKAVRMESQQLQVAHWRLAHCAGPSTNALSQGVRTANWEAGPEPWNARGVHMPGGCLASCAALQACVPLCKRPSRVIIWHDAASPRLQGFLPITVSRPTPAAWSRT